MSKTESCGFKTKKEALDHSEEFKEEKKMNGAWETSGTS